MSRTVKRPYTKSKRFDKSCRCHGGCSYCLSNRDHKNRKRKEKADEALKDWKKENEEQIDYD